jgi:predicted membrane-bound dolichyl-phosphate-mannose-protein mannosyltransferase
MSLPDIQTPPGAENLIQQFEQQLMSTVSALLATVDSTVVDVSRVAYVSLAMICLLLYYTLIERRLGKNPIKGGVALAIISEFVFPVLTRL